MAAREEARARDKACMDSLAEAHAELQEHIEAVHAIDAQLAEVK